LIQKFLLEKSIFTFLQIPPPPHPKKMEGVKFKFSHRFKLDKLETYLKDRRCLGELFFLFLLVFECKSIYFSYVSVVSFFGKTTYSQRSNKGNSTWLPV
jgi:hypothetical protein